MVVDHDLLEREPGDRGRRGLRAAQHLRAGPYLASVLPHVDRAVHRLHRDVRQERRLIYRFDLLRRAGERAHGVAVFPGRHTRGLRRLREPLHDVGGTQLRIRSVVPANGECRQPLLRRPHVVGHNGDDIIEPHDLPHARDCLRLLLVDAGHLAAQDRARGHRGDQHPRPPPYGIDVRLPGVLVATVAASPVLGGKVAGIDEQKAKAVPGVRQIVRLDDVVAVAADHMWAAKQGLAALAIRWDDGPNATLSTADIVQGLAKASETGGVTARKDGDPVSVLAGAATKVEAVYESPFLAHVTMEPMNCTVHVRKDGCEVWTGSQVLSRAQATAAAVTGFPLEKVVVHNHLLGGGFGRRLEVDYVTQAVRIAKQVDAPLKVVWTREEDVQHDVFRPYYYDRIQAGLDARGQPIAWTHRLVGPSLL